jgi:hypothetical protein
MDLEEWKFWTAAILGTLAVTTPLLIMMAVAILAGTSPAEMIKWLVGA